MGRPIPSYNEGSDRTITASTSAVPSDPLSVAPLERPATSVLNYHLRTELSLGGSSTQTANTHVSTSNSLQQDDPRPTTIGFEALRRGVEAAGRGGGSVDARADRIGTMGFERISLHSSRTAPRRLSAGGSGRAEAATQSEGEVPTPDSPTQASLRSLAALVDIPRHAIESQSGETSTSRAGDGLVQTVLSSPFQAVQTSAESGSTASYSSTANGGPYGASFARIRQAAPSHRLEWHRPLQGPSQATSLSTSPPATSAVNPSPSRALLASRERLSSFRERIMSSAAAGRSAESDQILRSARTALQLAVSYAERLEEATRSLTERATREHLLPPPPSTLLDDPPYDPPTTTRPFPPFPIRRAGSPPPRTNTTGSPRSATVLSLQRSIDQLRAASARIDVVLGDDWDLPPLRRVDPFPTGDEAAESDVHFAGSESTRERRERYRRRQTSLYSELDALSHTASPIVPSYASAAAAGLAPSLASGPTASDSSSPTVFASQRSFTASTAGPSSSDPSAQRLGAQRHPAVRNFRTQSRSSVASNSSSVGTTIHVTIDRDSLAESRLADEAAEMASTSEGSGGNGPRRRRRPWVKLDRNGDEVYSEDEDETAPVDPSSGFRKGSVRAGR